MSISPVPESSKAAAPRAYRAHALDVPPVARCAGVQVVRIDFDWSVPLASPAYASLSDAERARAGRFLRWEDTVRCAATRAALRDVLGSQLGIAPHAIDIVVGDAGRPALGPEHRMSLDFNVSHAGDHALLAWSAARRVGVDLERGNRTLDWRALTREVCTPTETAYLDGLPATARADAFMRVWSAKEALLKALGTGIAGGLHAFAVVPPRDAATPSMEVVVPAAPAAGVAAFDAAWLDAAPGYAACVAWTRD